ncbi:MAG: hypothetical protein HY543_04265, partial [Deltaproteobacteria bacterium]|nr:hypothetical protein [Deltaproteobacteria bacterium]
MNRFLLDTSIYIPLLRQGAMPSLLTRHQQVPLYLSAVVAQELLAGTGDDVTMKALQRFVSLFEQHDRLVA